ncbi:hypothetical protein CFIMG_003877RA [Ceratocystis fimbriata CBS 114723]|uniref:Ubiquitin interaction domain-containing protein n=1 Tax=Ceratocystis fimbriata CBS 114723 TaxID=1035309 RepID=A0A2C5XJN1_9PEZI|nr:hypothetical protein CFIMG_003877RA [Ceratocystis fimbriata CBS 114723]
MSPEPTDAAIQEVAEFTAFDDRAVITRALKANNNDTIRVVQEYFEDAEAFNRKYSWDNTVFTTDNDGNPQQGISFHIEAPTPVHPAANSDTGLDQSDAYYERLALSRPPSRTANPSPVNRVSEWQSSVTDSSMYNYSSHPDLNLPNVATSQEEEDLQKALRISAQESEAKIGHQEMGITTSVSPLHNSTTDTMPDTAPPPPAVSFGPARHVEYPENNWAMVSVSVNEYAKPQVYNIKPEARHRPYDTPAVLVLDDKSGTISTQDRLGGIITVLHSIPLARNILLDGSTSASYGHHHDWWKGAPILKGPSEDPLEADSLAQNEDEAELEWGNQHAGVSVNDELHRLIGLLEMSERSFGTINGLSDAMGGMYNLEARFFDYITGRNRQVAEPLLTVVRHVEIGTLRELEQRSNPEDANAPEEPEASAPEPTDDDSQETQVTYIEAEINSTSWPYIQSFTDIWDHVMWNDTVAYNVRPHAKSGMTCIEKQGQVMAVHINSEGHDAPFEIPRQFSVERYMTGRHEEAIGLMEMLVDQKLCLAKAEQRLRGLCKLPDGTTNSSPDSMLDRFASQIRDYEAQVRYIHDRARFREFASSGFDEAKFPCGPDDVPPKLLAEEQDIVDVLDHSIKALRDRHGRVAVEVESLKSHIAFHKEQLRNISTMYTDPKKPRPRPFVSQLMHLRGVVCDSGVVYVCQRQEQKLVEVDVETEAQPVDQWWRLKVVPDAEPAVQAEKVDWGRIAHGVWKDGKNPLLVYATQLALDTNPIPLPEPLAKFVRFDNRLFHHELSQSAAKENDATNSMFTQASGHHPPSVSLASDLDHIRSPGKRKHRSGSPDSMASNRVSIGSEVAAYGSDVDMDLQTVTGDFGSTVLDASSSAAAAGAVNKDREDDQPPSYHLIANLGDYNDPDKSDSASVHEISLSADEAAAATLDQPPTAPVVEMSQVNNGAHAMFRSNLSADAQKADSKHTIKREDRALIEDDDADVPPLPERRPMN